MKTRALLRSCLAVCFLAPLFLTSWGCERMSAEAIFPEKMAQKKVEAEAAAAAPTATPAPLPSFFPGSTPPSQ